MLVKFTDGPAALQLPDGTVAPRGEAVEVPKSLGEALLGQGWKRVNTKSKEKN